MLNEFHITDIDQLWKITETHKDREWAYRGHQDAKWELESSLYRALSDRQVNWNKKASRFGKEKIHDPILEQELENSLIERFRTSIKLLTNAYPIQKNNLEWLSIMQHYGCPTRLLDFTYSPYVALFFAVERGLTDFSILMVNLSDIRRLTGSSYGSEYENLWTYEGARNPYALMFDPDEANERQLHQKGTFFTPSTLSLSFTEIIERNTVLRNSVTKLVFPSSLRYSAIESLRKMNLTAQTLYLGIDGFCRSLAFELYK